MFHNLISNTIIMTGSWRHRERGTYTYPMSVYTAYNGAGNVNDTNVFGNGQREYMDDFVTPNFSKRSARGEIVMNPMYREIRSKTSRAISHAHVYKNGYPAQWYIYSGGPCTRLDIGVGSGVDLVARPGSFLISYDDVASAEVEASTKLLSNIGRASTDSWENIAEMKKTLSSLWSPLSSWFQFERKARAASLAMSSVNAWLMYRYGIRPLVGSVNDIMTAVAERSDPTARKTERTRVSISSNAKSSYNHSTLGVSATVQVTKTESVEVRCMSVDEVSRDWKYKYGFDAKSLLTLPWNLIPYSFVADWFFNIGDLIGAVAEATYQPVGLGRCTSTTQVGTEVRTGTTNGWAAGYTVVAPCRSEVREDLVSKQRVLGVRSPSLVIKSNFKLDDLTRLGDAVALAGQQILSRFGGVNRKFTNTFLWNNS